MTTNSGNNGMRHFRHLILLASVLFTSTAIAADLPSRGRSMHSVEATYGSPITKHAPVPAIGTQKNPPITRWDYSEFSVFFEYDHVVHAVSPHNRAKVYLD